MTSLQTQVRHAVVAIAEADNTLRTLAKRQSRIVVNWRDLSTATLPVVAMQVVSNAKVTGTGEQRRMVVQLTAVADGNTAQDIAEAMASRLREILLQPAFALQGVDVAPLDDLERQDDAEAAALSARGRADLDLTLVALGAPIT